jgi:hypothetical protein
VTGKETSSIQPRVIKNTVSESLDFVEPFEPGLNPADRYSAYDFKDKDLVLTSLKIDNSRLIIPTPLRVSRSSDAGPIKDSTVQLGSHWKVDYVGHLGQMAAYLAGEF